MKFDHYLVEKKRDKKGLESITKTHKRWLDSTLKSIKNSIRDIDTDMKSDNYKYVILDLMTIRDAIELILGPNGLGDKYNIPSSM